MATGRVEYPSTAGEFFARPRGEGREELVRGTVIREPVPGQRHARVVARITYLLEAHVRRSGLGGAVLAETGYVAARCPDQVRGSDVSFVGQPRYRAGHIGFVEDGADLAVEVLSPHDRPGEIAARIADQFRAGARLCWVVAPATRTVTVHRPDGTREIRAGEDVLDGDEVLPGLAVRAAELFEP